MHHKITKTHIMIIPAPSKHSGIQYEPQHK